MSVPTGSAEDAEGLTRPFSGTVGAACCVLPKEDKSLAPEDIRAMVLAAMPPARSTQPPMPKGSKNDQRFIGINLTDSRPSLVRRTRQFGHCYMDIRRKTDQRLPQTPRGWSALSIKEMDADCHGTLRTLTSIIRPTSDERPWGTTSCFSDPLMAS